ncbi:MAG: Fe-S cluster assembly protein SufD [Pseudomonadota bacterium]|jgi:Fe-S cluster assembly protein SufD
MKTDMSWLSDFRHNTLAQFEQSGFPSQRLEDWRYTNVSAIEKKQFALASQSEKLDDHAKHRLATFTLKDCYHCVFVDGFFQASLSTLPESITVCAINEAATHHETLLAPVFNQAIRAPHGFTHFTNAHFSDGVFVCVNENSQLDQPLQIIHFATQEAMSATRHVVILQNNAVATLIETFIGVENQAYLTSSVLEIFLHDNADLTLYKVQQDSDKAYHFGGTYIQQADNARFTHHNFALGSVLARSEIMSHLETGAQCELNGLYLGANRQHLDNLTRIVHAKPDAVSREYYKGILNNRARGVFQGRIVVAEDAQRTDSQMNNRNLLLSSDAEIDTKPQLEIYADDVKCAHGVTVGQLDEKSIFYLQSRGIDEDHAKHILTFAFANEMVDKITVPSLRDCVFTQLLARFPEGAER